MPLPIIKTLAIGLVMSSIAGSAIAKNKFDFKSGLSQFGEPVMLQMDYSGGKYRLRSKTYAVPIRYHAEVSGVARLVSVAAHVKHILKGNGKVHGIRRNLKQRKVFGNVNLQMDRGHLAPMEKMGADLCSSHNGSKAKLIKAIIPMQMDASYTRKGGIYLTSRQADMPAMFVCNPKSAAGTSSFKVKMTKLTLYTIPANPRCGQQVRLITELWTNVPGTIDLRLTRNDGGQQDVSLTTAKVSGGFSKRWAKTYTFKKSVDRKYKISASGSPFSTPWVPLKVSCGVNNNNRPGALKN